MGCMLRSDLMTKCRMYLQPEVAFEVLSELGEISCVQFIDLFPDLQLFQRQFVMEVCRYSEMERKLRFMKREMDLAGITPHPPDAESKPLPLAELEEFENLLQKWEEDILEITQNEAALVKAYLELSEFLYVLKYIGPLLGSAELRKEALWTSKKSGRRGGAGDVGARGGRLMVTTGVVRRARAYTFEVMLWRISHGIIYYKQAPEDKILTDPQTRLETRKVAFVAIVQGDALQERVQKVCSGFKVNTFPCPKTPAERNNLVEKLETRIDDLEQVIAKTRYYRCRFFRDVAKSWRIWIGTVRKSKAIYHTLNMFRFSKRNCLIGEYWVPDADMYQVNELLQETSEKFQSSAPSFSAKLSTNEMPPTYHRVNKFTRGFQNLINAYGDSTYRELNPGLYTLVTFPFLFAMMFGDLGHGFILVLFGGWMWKNEEKFLAEGSTNEIWNILFGGRYVVLMMGLFSVYTGFCYNDLFSRAFSLHPSYWLNVLSVPKLMREEYFDLDPTEMTRTPYIFGEDPVWRMAKNKIMFENSFKMKISIIIGIIHMMFGIILSFFNYLHFGRTYSIVLQFLPEVLFLTLMFFWLVVMVFLKWFLYSPKSPDPEKNTACAPQILILFIDMVLMSETQPANEGCTKAYLFEGQRSVQMILVFSALACVPVLLFGTPIYKLKRYAKQKQAAVNALAYHKHQMVDDPKTEEALLADVEKYSVSFSELMIHQGVHTIEFVLSTISHTASYLRLWALSLAHSQLSEMLWNMILSKLALHIRSLMGAIRLIPIFALWAVFTISILVVMEGLSAFLHCLRLHWVEFMSKFYEGGGWPFRPYCFKALLASETVKVDAGCKKFDVRV